MGSVGGMGGQVPRSGLVAAVQAFRRRSPVSSSVMTVAPAQPVSGVGMWLRGVVSLPAASRGRLRARVGGRARGRREKAESGGQGYDDADHVATISAATDRLCPARPVQTRVVRLRRIAARIRAGVSRLRAARSRFGRFGKVQKHLDGLEDGQAPAESRRRTPATGDHHLVPVLGHHPAEDAGPLEHPIHPRLSRGTPIVRRGSAGQGADALGRYRRMTALPIRETAIRCVRVHPKIIAQPARCR